MRSAMSSLVMGIVLYIIIIIPFVKLFEKAQEPAWKAIVPIVNTYTLYKITWNKKMFWVTFALGIVIAIVGAGLTTASGESSSVALMVIYWILTVATWIIGIVSMHKTSLAYSHKTGFTIGLIFLYPIFIWILAFSQSSDYIGPQ